MEVLRQAFEQKLETLSRASGVGVVLFDTAGRRVVASEQAPGGALCDCVCSCEEGARRCLEFHQSAGYTAYQTGNAYTARCHAGAVTITAPAILKERPAGFAALMPLWMWEWDEAAEAELLQWTKDLDLDLEALLAAGAHVPALDSGRVNALADLLMDLVSAPSDELLFHRAYSGQQQRIGELLQERKQEPGGSDGASARPHDYPIQVEREMLSRVRMGDKKGARAMLNELLAHIFLRSPGNIELMKARLLELVVMISRAAVESGAELEKLLGLNYNFISEASGIDGYEEISAWIVKVLDTFLDTVYESRGNPESRQLNDALSFIRQHFAENLTLEEVAAQAYVSPFYLSHMFKEKLGVTFVEYLTRVRMETAKNYLLNTRLSIADIAERVGYEDAGYFGKVFKRAAGVTPKGFRRGD